MNYQTEHDADDAHARTGYKYKTNELTQLRARVAKLEAVCQQLAKFKVGPSQRMHDRWIGEVLAIAAKAREALEGK